MDGAITGGNHDHAGAHFAQVDIVQRTRPHEITDLAIKTIDIRPGLLVRADNQAGGGIGSIASDGWIVCRIGCYCAHRRCLSRRHDVICGIERTWWGLNPCTSAKRKGREQSSRPDTVQSALVHQKLIRTPAA